MVVTTFYVKGQAVWKREWYSALTDEEILEENAELKDRGYGEVTAITDTKGRMIAFVKGDFLREVE